MQRIAGTQPLLLDESEALELLELESLEPDDVLELLELESLELDSLLELPEDSELDEPELSELEDRELLELLELAEESELDEAELSELEDCELLDDSELELPEDSELLDEWELSDDVELSDDNELSDDVELSNGPELLLELKDELELLLDVPDESGENGETRSPEPESADLRLAIATPEDKGRCLTKNRGKEKLAWIVQTKRHNAKQFPPKENHGNSTSIMALECARKKSFYWEALVSRPPSKYISILRIWSAVGAAACLLRMLVGASWRESTRSAGYPGGTAIPLLRKFLGIALGDDSRLRDGRRETHLAHGHRQSVKTSLDLGRSNNMGMLMRVLFNMGTRRARQRFASGLAGVVSPFYFACYIRVRAENRFTTIATGYRPCFQKVPTLAPRAAARAGGLGIGIYFNGLLAGIRH